MNAHNSVEMCKYMFSAETYAVQSRKSTKSRIYVLTFLNQSAAEVLYKMQSSSKQ